MTGLWWVPFAAGIEDSFGPCALMAAAVTGLLYVWLERRRLDTRRFLIVFMAVLLGLTVIFSLGFFVFFLAAPIVQSLAQGFYKVLGIAVLAAGAVLFYDWTLLMRGKQPLDIVGRVSAVKPGTPGPKTAYAVVIAVAVLVAVAGTIWPPNEYVTMTSNNFLMPGRRLHTLALVAVYAVIQLWLAWVLALVLVRRKLTLSLQQLVCSAIFLTAGGSALYFL